MCECIGVVGERLCYEIDFFDKVVMVCSYLENGVGCCVCGMFFCVCCIRMNR